MKEQIAMQHTNTNGKTSSYMEADMENEIKTLVAKKKK